MLVNALGSVHTNHRREAARSGEPLASLNGGPTPPPGKWHRPGQARPARGRTTKARDRLLLTPVETPLATT